MREDKEDFKITMCLPDNYAVQFLMAELRKRYWVTQAKISIEEVVRKCITCKRYRILHPISICI